MFEASLCKF